MSGCKDHLSKGRLYQIEKLLGDHYAAFSRKTSFDTHRMLCVAIDCFDRFDI